MAYRSSFGFSIKHKVREVKFGRGARFLSLNVESAALPERLGIVATDLLTIREGETLATYPAIERLHNCKRA
jgi:hypothetical protein